MRQVLLDTNIYSAFKRNNPNVVTSFKYLDYIGMDVTVLAELTAGFKNGTREPKNRKDLEAFLNTPRVHLLGHDAVTAEFYAQIHLNLKKNGTPIPTNDIWISAVAMQNGLAVFTRDRHFSKVDGLVVKTIS